VSTRAKPSDRQYATYILGDHPEDLRAAVVLVDLMLHDPDEHTRATATSALSSFGESAFVRRALLDKLFSTDSRHVRATAIMSLETFPAPDTVDRLVSFYAFSHSKDVLEDAFKDSLISDPDVFAAQLRAGIARTSAEEKDNGVLEQGVESLLEKMPVESVAPLGRLLASRRGVTASLGALTVLEGIAKETPTTRPAVWLAVTPALTDASDWVRSDAQRLVTRDLPRPLDATPRRAQEPPRADDSLRRWRGREDHEQVAGAVRGHFR